MCSLYTSKPLFDVFQILPKRSFETLLLLTTIRLSDVARASMLKVT